VARSSTIPDSLELMLDTICNSFGGIVLITILLALLTRNRITTKEEELTKQLEHVATANERDGLKEKVRIIEESIEALRNSAGTLPQEMQALLTEREELEQRDREIRDRLEQMAQQEQLAASRAEELAASQRTLKEEIDRKQKELESTRRELAKVEGQTTFTLHLPREASLPEFGPALILRYDRMYVWHEYDAGGNRLGLNTREFLVLEEDGNGFVVTPRPDRGILISPDNGPAIVQRLKACRAGNGLDIGLWDDTFDRWPIFRAAIVKAGFRYRLLLVQKDGELWDRGGDYGYSQ